MENPLEWFKKNVLNRGAAAPKGGAMVPVKAGQLLSPSGIQQITTNLKVPGGAAVPGGGLGMLGARGQNFGIIDKPIDAIAGEAVRGAMVVTGQDTTDFDTARSGKPVVRNVGGKSFNIATPEGQRGYQKALQAGEEKSTPKTYPAPSPTGRDVPAPDGNAGAGTKAVPSGAGFAEANKMLRNVGVGGVGYGDFQSNSLFTGDTSGIKATDPSQKVESMVDMPNFVPQDNISADFQAQIPKGSEFSVSEAVVPEAAGSYGSNPSGVSGELGTKERYRSEMLNNGSTALGGLRGAEASKGLLYASGKYWQANPNAGQEGQKDFLEISNDQAKAIKASDMNAQDFLASKIDAVKPPAPSETAGPLADADAYGAHLKTQQDKYKVTGQGPVRDADEYGKMLNR